MFIFDSVNMKLLYFQNSVETFNIKMSIIARLGIDLEYYLGYSQVTNKLQSIKQEWKPVRSTGYIQIRTALQMD